MNTNSQGQNPSGAFQCHTSSPVGSRLRGHGNSGCWEGARSCRGQSAAWLKALRCVSDAREACGFPSWCCRPQGVQPKTNTILENAPPRAPGTAPGRAVGTKCAARSDLTRVSATTAPEGFRRVSTVTALLARGQEAGGAQGRF